MKIVKNSERIQRFQQGGAAPVQDPAMAAQAQPQQSGDPLMEIAQIFMQGLQTQNCEMLAQGAQAFLMLLQQAQGAEQQAPVGQPQGEPVFKKGGKICKRKKKVKKDECGGKLSKKCNGGSFKKCNGGTMK